MADERQDPSESGRESGRDRETGPGGASGASGAGPGRAPDREAPGGRPSREGPTPGSRDEGGSGSRETTAEGGPGREREAGGETRGEDDGEGAERRRGARRAWGDAFSEVQSVVGEVVGDVLEGVRDAAAGRFPRMDLIRVEGEGYRLLVDLPGLSREDVEVLTLGNELTVKGERPRPELPEGSEVLRSERAHGKFERTIRMPPEVREEGVAASFQDGVLTVRLPRAEPSDARTVDIG